MPRDLFARRRAQPPAPRTYADVLEVMRYARSMDVLPHAVAYRPRPPHVDASGPEPHFALLDSEAEFKAFMDVLHGPLVFERSGMIATAPLHQWNEKPSTLAAELSINSFYYPDDESRGWPFMLLFAISPAQFAEGHCQPEDTERGRYVIHQFPPSEKQRLVDQLMDSSSAGPRIFINDKVTYSQVEALIPRARTPK